MTLRKRPRFNGSADDHAATEQWNAPLRTDEMDGATYEWGGASDIGVMAIATFTRDVNAVPLDGYQPQPASFPALQAAPPAFVPILADVPVTEPAVIGDELKLPVIWCEMPGCIGFFLDEESAGFADARQRAHAARWRTDALGRLACPGCQQGRSDYRAPRPVTCHHPEVRRRWHWDDEYGNPNAEVQRRWASGEHLGGHIGIGEEETFRLGVEAELGHRVTREDFDLACAIGDATHRTTAS